jgi:hypothetical protein
MAVRVDLNISLDGSATTTDQTPDKPIGEDWGRLVAAYVATRTFRERVLHDTSGEGTTGVDDAYAERYFDEIGAEIMGAGMFGLHTFPDDPGWRGWWGDEPPFRCPVFVLTHSQRPSIEFPNGTSFHFLSAAPGRPWGGRSTSRAGGTCASAAAPPSSASTSGRGWWTSSTSRSRRFCWAAASGSGTTSEGSSPATR